MESFLGAIDTHLKLTPDFQPKQLADKIRPKCRVVYFPVELPPCSSGNTGLHQHSEDDDSTVSLTEEVEAEVVCEESGNPEEANLSELSGGTHGLEVSKEVAALKSTPLTYSLSGGAGTGHVTMEEPSTAPSGLCVGPVSGRSSPRRTVATKRHFDPISADDDCPLHIVWPHRW